MHLERMLRALKKKKKKNQVCFVHVHKYLLPPYFGSLAIIRDNPNIMGRFL
jgi:hypothetical protein